jgi:hypothetical protein
MGDTMHNTKNTITTQLDGRSVSVSTTRWVGRVSAAISVRSVGTNTTRKIR